MATSIQITEATRQSIVTPYQETIKAHEKTIKTMEKSLERELARSDMDTQDLRDAKEEIKALKLLISTNTKTHADETKKKETEHAQQLQQYKSQLDEKNNENVLLEEMSMEHVLKKTRMPASQIQKTVQFIKNTQEGSSIPFYNSKKRAYDEEKFIGFDIMIQFQHKTQRLQTHINKMQSDDEEEVVELDN